jgi:predicted metal-dependent hydrolase
MDEMAREATGKTGKPTTTRNKPERPRDELGRPQPWEAENTLHLEDYESFTVDEKHRLARDHLNHGRYFPAHEAWETAWKQSRDTDDAEFFKGLSQLGAGYTHLLRGNAHGAIRLLTRGSGRLRRYPPEHRDIRTREVADRADALAAAIERREVLPGEHAEFERPAV